MNRDLPLSHSARGGLRRRVVLATAVLAILAGGLSACRRGSDDANAPLAYVPADTPYVFANLEPMDGAVMESWWRLVEPMRVAYVETLARTRAKLLKDGGDSEETQRVLSVMELFEDKLSIEGWERIGFSREARAAFYGVGVLPVMRVELRDPEALRAFFAEIETRSGKPWPTAEIEGQAYWRFQPEAEKPFAFVMAILDGQLVMTLDPGEEYAPLGTLLGLTRPDESLLDSDGLEKLNDQYGFGPHGTVLVDMRRLASALLGSEGHETWLTRAMAAEGKPLSAACRSEFTAMAEIAPRMVGGYTRIDRDSMDANTVIELRQDIATAMQAMSAPVPGLGSSAGQAAVEFGFGLKLDKLAEFLQAQASAIRAAPYTCEHLVQLNEGATQMGQQMAGLYMAAGWFTGMRVVLTELTFGENNQPERIDGSLVIASPSPAGLVGMIQGFVPQLAALELAPGGPPKQIDLSEMAGAGMTEVPPTWIAMSDAAIGLATGAGAEAALVGQLAAAAPQPAPLMHMSYDGAFYARMMRKFDDVVQAAGTDEGDEVIFDFETDPQADPETGAPIDPVTGSDASASGSFDKAEFDRLMQPFVTSMYAMYDAIDYTAADVVATERGIEMRQVVRLK